jgi:hypothetical protein
MQDELSAEPVAHSLCGGGHHAKARKKACSFIEQLDLDWCTKAPKYQGRESGGMRSQESPRKA